MEEIFATKTRQENFNNKLLVLETLCDERLNEGAFASLMFASYLSKITISKKNDDERQASERALKAVIF